MQQQTETNVSSIIGPGIVAREGPAALNLGAVRGSIGHLVNLFTQSKEAEEEFSLALKVVAEQSGFLPAVLRKLVKARAGEKFDKARQEVEQLSLVFEEVGE